MLFSYCLTDGAQKSFVVNVFDRGTRNASSRSWNYVTHCVRPCKVNSPESLLVAVARMICSAGCLGGMCHMGDAFACQVACGES